MFTQTHAKFEVKNLGQFFCNKMLKLVSYSTTNSRKTGRSIMDWYMRTRFILMRKNQWSACKHVWTKLAFFRDWLCKIYHFLTNLSLLLKVPWRRKRKGLQNSASLKMIHTSIHCTQIQHEAVGPGLFERLLCKHIVLETSFLPSNWDKQHDIP